MTEPVARYAFTDDEILAALSRRMRDMDARNGISFIEPNREQSAETWPHRITKTATGIVVEVFREMPEPTPEPVLSLVLKRAPRMGKEPP